jgi:hypothetical protein
MKEQFYLFKRNGIYYVQDVATGRQHSLKTKDGTEARRLLHAKNEAGQCPTLNVAMARVYLSARDPKMLERTWQDVINEFCSRGKQQTRTSVRRISTGGHAVSTKYPRMSAGMSGAISTQ